MTLRKNTLLIKIHKILNFACKALKVWKIIEDNKKNKCT